MLAKNHGGMEGECLLLQVVICVSLTYYHCAYQGPDILETSTEMIHNGELHKISKGHSQERHFFLFDHQLIYCKKVYLVLIINHRYDMTYIIS